MLTIKEIESLEPGDIIYEGSYRVEVVTKPNVSFEEFDGTKRKQLKWVGVYNNWLSDLREIEFCVTEGLEQYGAELYYEPQFYKRENNTVNKSLNTIPKENKAVLYPGYRLKHINKGVFGELSKVREELEEAEDASSQGNRLMLLMELSDIIGAVSAVADNNNSSLDELLTMHRTTKRAFMNGHRK